MVRNLWHAQWHVWPNGHPVVQLSSGRTFDVVALVNGQASTGAVQLAELYADAARADGNDDGNVDHPEQSHAATYARCSPATCASARPESGREGP